MPRLNPNQYKHRLRYLVDVADVAPDQIWQMLDESGILEKLRAASYIPGADGTVRAPEGSDLTPAQKREQVLHALWLAASEGDPQAARAYNDLERQHEAADAATGLVIHIVPAAVPDTLVVPVPDEDVEDGEEVVEADG